MGVKIIKYGGNKKREAKGKEKKEIIVGNHFYKINNKKYSVIF